MSAKIAVQIDCLGQTLAGKLDQIITQNAGSHDYEFLATPWLCDSTTNTWQRVVTPQLNGLPQGTVNVDSFIPCTQPAPAADDVDSEFEMVCNGTTGFYDMVTVVTTNGVAAAPVITASTISCAGSAPLVIGSGLQRVFTSTWDSSANTVSNKVKSVSVVVVQGPVTISASNTAGVLVPTGFTTTWAVDGNTDILETIQIAAAGTAEAFVSWTEEG